MIILGIRIGIVLLMMIWFWAICTAVNTLLMFVIADLKRKLAKRRRASQALCINRDIHSGRSVQL